MHMNKEIVMVRVSDIIPNRFQPRLTFDEEALNELANSIKEHGIIQPLILRDLGSKYEIIAGERRYKAATLAGLTEVPAIVGSMDDQTSAEVALIENIQRKDLSAIEEAKSYQKVLELGGLTQETLAKRMGKGQSTIANKMRLLTLTNEVQVALMNNLISERHARCLLQIKDEDKQKEVLNKIINERMNVRDTDNYIKSMLGLPNQEIPAPISPENIENFSAEPANTEKEPSLEMIDIDNSEEKNELPIDNPVPMAKENNSLDDKKNKKPNKNPNVYTQTENVDFVNISNLNDEEISTSTESPSLEETPNSPELTNNTDLLDKLRTEDKVVPESDVNNMNNFDLPSIDVNIQNNNPVSPQNNLSKIKLATAIRLAKDTVEDIKTAGYKVTLEEVDGDSDYSLIIKVQK